jgi:hypothetical protein
VLSPPPGRLKITPGPQPLEHVLDPLHARASRGHQFLPLHAIVTCSDDQFENFPRESFVIAIVHYAQPMPVNAVPSASYTTPRDTISGDHQVLQLRDSLCGLRSDCFPLFALEQFPSGLGILLPGLLLLPNESPR